MVPIRRSPDAKVPLLQALECLANEIIVKKQAKYSCIMIAAETLDHAKEINTWLLEVPALQPPPVFFVTDTHSREERFVFEHILLFNKNSINEYETVTIELSGQDAP